LTNFVNKFTVATSNANAYRLKVVISNIQESRLKYEIQIKQQINKLANLEFGI